MHLRSICVFFIKYCIMLVVGGDDYDEKIHFKIHVPEFINHHHHTKIVYVHDKPPSIQKPNHEHSHQHSFHKGYGGAEVNADVGLDDKAKYPFKPSQHDPKPKFHDSYGNVVKGINLNVGLKVADKNQFPVTAPKIQYIPQIIPQIKIINTKIITKVPESPTSALDLDQYHRHISQQNSHDLNLNTNHFKFNPNVEKTNEEIHYENEYNKAADNFEKNYESNKNRESLEKLNDFGELKNDLQNNIYFGNNLGSIYDVEDKNVVKNNYKTIKNEQIEFQSIKSSTPQSGNTISYDGYKHTTTPNSLHSYFFPNSNDEIKYDEEKKSFEEVSYEQHVSPYHKYFPESHNQQILEAEIAQHFESLRTPSFYHNALQGTKHDLNLDYQHLSNGGKYFNNYEDSNFNSDLNIEQNSDELADLNSNYQQSPGEFADLNSNYEYTSSNLDQIK